MSPRPSTAVPSLTMATVFFLMVSSWASAGSAVDRHADAGDARRVGHREVVAVADRRQREHLDLAALVHGEGAVLASSSSSTPSSGVDGVDAPAAGGPRCVQFTTTSSSRYGALGLEAARAPRCCRRPRRSRPPVDRACRARCRGGLGGGRENAAVGVSAIGRQRYVADGTPPPVECASGCVGVRRPRSRSRARGRSRAAWNATPSASAMAAQVPPRSTSTRIITGSAPSSRTTRDGLQRRGAAGDGVLGDRPPCRPGCERSGQAAGDAVVLGLLADGERPQVAAPGRGDGGDAVGHRVGADGEAADGGDVVGDQPRGRGRP